MSILIVDEDCKFFKYCFYYCSNIVVSIFTLPCSPPQPSPPPTLEPTPLALSMCPLYMFLDGLSPILPHYPSPPSLLVTVSLYFILMSLVVFCSLVCFVDYIPLIGEIIWYSSFTTWLISLSLCIIFTSFIHAVMKDSSSFFLSAM